MVRPGLAPAVFLDRDGVIVVPEFRDQRSFAPRRLQDFRLYPEAAASLGRLKRAGFLLAVVTNQPNVGRGLIPRSEVEAMHEIITRELPVSPFSSPAQKAPAEAGASRVSFPRRCPQRTGTARL